MDLPTSRELELETLLRKRDKQLLELTDELAHLRRHLVVQPGPSTTDALTLPPALVSVLLPRLTPAPAAGGTPSGSNTVTTALTQRVRLLQEENDEIYELLKHGETGKLKEEVRGLRRVVQRLEGALRESHQVIQSLSTELDKSYDILTTTARQNNAAHTHSSSESPRNSYHTPLPHPNSAGSTQNSHSSSKALPPPTAPRAHKKPRLSESNASPLPPHKSHNRGSRPPPGGREYTPRHSSDGRKGSGHSKMEIDDARAVSPNDYERRDRDRGRDHERERERERGVNRERERERDRDRDGSRFSRRNGHSNGGHGRGSGGPGRRVDRAIAAHGFAGGDRTLAERLGL
ncbi:hypothetical protein BD779DRAFT_1491983 [Infundibulicybe gibba]|nr:hypothetical protein BD779DRAFT_1491983 [Infundibulicybe gibba]